MVKLVLVIVVLSIVGIMLLISSCSMALITVLVYGEAIFVGFSRRIDYIEIGLAMLFLYLLVWGLLGVLQSPRHHIWGNPVLKASFAILFMLIAGILVGIARGNPVMNIVRDASRFLGYLFVFPVVYLIRTRKKAWGLAKGVLVVGVFLWIINLLVWRSKRLGVPFLVNGAFYGSEYGRLFLFSLIVFVILCKDKFKQIVGGFLTLGWVGMIIYSTMRHCLVEFLIAVMGSILLTSFKGNYRSKTGVCLILAAVVIFLWILNVVVAGELSFPGSDVAERLYSYVTSAQTLREDPSFQGRLLESNIALERFAREPFWGLGLGSRLEFLQFGRYWKSRLWLHIWWIELLYKFGLLGLALFAYYLLTLLRWLLSLAQLQIEDVSKALVCGFTLYVVITAVPAIGSFGYPGTGWVVGLFAGLIPVLLQDESRSGWYVPPYHNHRVVVRE